MTTPSPQPPDGTDAGYTLVETVVAAVILVAALFPVVAAVLHVSADPVPRWTAKALELAQTEAERTVRLDSERWTNERLEDGLWRTNRRVERTGLLVRAVVEVWREGRGQGGSEADPLVTLPVARLGLPSDPTP